MTSDLHISVEMTEDRRENTDRRAAAYATAILHAVSDPGIRKKMGMDPELPDPLTRLRMALGAGYSDLHMGIARHVIVQRLRELIKDDQMAGVALAHHSHLSSLVAARSVGDRCGDHISKIQLGLLTEAFTKLPTPETPDAA